jgi:hypothetical protein
MSTKRGGLRIVHSSKFHWNQAISMEYWYEKLIEVDFREHGRRGNRKQKVET